ncbi:MAG: hypothetical protein M1829_004338 [Trizodia sp. TS-e1964]|nr:MAG: hypothetical protein M1829_004338 [Trizodia sp. TS-e1964]
MALPHALQVRSNKNSDVAEHEPFLLTVSEDLVAPRTPKPAGIASIDFNKELATPLQLHEDLTKGCGGQIWPAGMVLARYLLGKLKADNQVFLGKKIVELGAGGGLVGLALAKGCDIGCPLYITDQTPMLALMKKNIQLNGLEEKVQAEVLDWGDSIPDEILNPPPDIILAADCVYFQPAFPLLQETLMKLMGPATKVYFCFKRRRRADLLFMKKAHKLFDVSEISDDPDKESYSRENIFL